MTQPPRPGRKDQHNSSYVGNTNVGGQCFSPVPLSSVSNTFFTSVDLAANPSGSPALPSLIAPRPLSAMERAGIPAALRSMSPVGGRSRTSHDKFDPRNALSQTAMSRPSSSMSVELPVLSVSEDANYEPSLTWYQKHFFYTKDKKAAGPAASQRSASVVDGANSSFDGTMSDTNPIFKNVLGSISGSRQRVSQYSGDYGERVAELKERFQGKDRDSSSCMASFFSNLVFRVNENGYISFADVIFFLRDLVPPLSAETFAETCRKYLTMVAGTTLQSGANDASTLLPFSSLFNHVESLFVGKHEAVVLRKCFALCDVTGCGYILKDSLRSFRDEERLAAMIAANAAQSQVPQSPVIAAVIDKPTSLVVPPVELTYLVVKGVWRVFEKVALAEEEKARNANTKGKKKSKKGGNGPVVITGKRQFHMNYQELCSGLKEDPYVMIAFLPFAIEVALREKLSD